MIRFTCSACSKNISVPPEHAGRQVRCPGCHHVQLAPESPEPILTPDPSSPEPAPTNDERVEIEPAEPPPMPAPPSLSTEPLEQDPPDTRFFAPLIYPFTGSGKFNMLMLLIPLALFAVMQYLMFLFMSASFVPFIGKLIVLAADLAYAIYVGAYMLSILASSANGELEPPDWPAFSGWWSDVIRPVLSCWIVAIIPFIPAIIYLVWAVLRAIHGTRGASISPEAFRALSIIFWLSIAAGWALSPMVLLAAVLSEPFEALRPSLIFGSIARTFPAYLGSIVFMFLVNALNSGVLYLTLRFLLFRGTALGIMAFYFIIGLVFVYCSIVMMRILGLYYFKHQQELDWF